MKRNNSRLALILFALLSVMPVSCVNQDTATPSNEAKTEPIPAPEKKPEPTQLPVRFQNSSYVIQDEQAANDLGVSAEDHQIKVGANISSTQGPQPLWDILKRLTSLKGMNVSWASDVTQSDLVDVDINADDNFFEAIDNLLRQVDYYHEVKGNTIVVKYKETRTFHLPLPFMKSKYTSNVGGNFLAAGSSSSSSAIEGNTTQSEGTVKVTSSENETDIWENVKLNIESILEIWSGRRELETIGEELDDEKAKEASRTYKGTAEANTSSSVNAGEESTIESQGVTKRAAQGYYTIDKHVGIINVTAPRPLMEKVEQYINTLKNEVYRQVIIEAKIIEVYLQDNSRIGIDWSLVLKNFDIRGLVEFGTGGALGQVWPWNPPDELKDTANYSDSYPDSFVSTISLAAAPFTVMLNALNEQGEATVLSNPKIAVLNGQPAVISVGTNVTYISSISVDIDAETGVRTYSSETDTVVEGVALGVVASIVDDDSVILHLTPITTDIVGDTIEYRSVGEGEVGLPVIQVREMTTMVQVNNGEMLIIGGLIDSSNKKEGSFAPVLGDIPLLKYLFGVEEKVKEKRELVILLTPKIM